MGFRPRVPFNYSTGVRIAVNPRFAVAAPFASLLLRSTQKMAHWVGLATRTRGVLRTSFAKANAMRSCLPIRLLIQLILLCGDARFWRCSRQKRRDVRRLAVASGGRGLANVDDLRFLSNVAVTCAAADGGARSTYAHRIL